MSELAQKPPEVRQCVDPAHPLFGASALRTTRPENGWGIMTSNNGGHHAEPGEVDDIENNWKVMK